MSTPSLDQLLALEQLPSVVNELVLGYGTPVNLTINAKKGFGKGIPLGKDLPIFTTFIVDVVTDYMYGLVRNCSKIIIYNPIGEQTGDYYNPISTKDYNFVKEKLQFCVKSGVLCVSHYRDETNYISVHRQTKSGSQFTCQQSFPIFCDHRRIEDIKTNADGTMLIASWVVGILLIDINTKTIVQKIYFDMRFSEYLNSMTVSAADVVYDAVYVSYYANGRILRVPLREQNQRQNQQQLQQEEQNQRQNQQQLQQEEQNQKQKQHPSHFVSRGQTIIESRSLRDPCHIAISPHNEIFVSQQHASGELLIISGQQQHEITVGIIRMPLSQLQFRSNGSLVTYRETDGIRLYTASN